MAKQDDEEESLDLEAHDEEESLDLEAHDEEDVDL